MHPADRQINYFMEEARLAATMSKHPNTQVGAVIVRPNLTIVSKGRNGFPPGFNDDPGNFGEMCTLHAEMNAILFAREPMEGYAMWTWPFQPCERCALAIAQVGIDVVFSPEAHNTKWDYTFGKARRVFEEADVKLFFTNHKTPYNEEKEPADG